MKIYRGFLGIAALVIILAGCTSAEITPEVKFSGEPVTLPIAIAGFVERTPVCTYTMGDQKGVVVVPAIIFLKFTDQKQVLKLDCLFDEFISFRKKNIWGHLGNPFKGRSKFEVETSFYPKTNYSTDFVGDRRSIRYRTPDGLREIRTKAIRERGIQAVDPAILLFGRDIVPGKAITDQAQVDRLISEGKLHKAEYLKQKKAELGE